MSKSTPPLNASSSPHREGLLLLLFALLLIAYCLPWVTNPPISLTFGAYDWAEWLSISPLSHPTRLAPLLLRLQLLFLTWLLALGAYPPLRSAGWWLRALIVVALIAAQLPPFEFLSQRSDPNYGQQFILAVLSLIGALIGLSGVLWRWRRWLVVLLVGAALFTSLTGVLQGLEIMRRYDLPNQIGMGIGLPLFVADAVLYVGLHLFQRRANL